MGKDDLRWAEATWEDLRSAAHKVAGHGSGAALMKSPALAEAIVRTAVQALRGAGSALPVSVKMRTGYDPRSFRAWTISWFTSINSVWYPDSKKSWPIKPRPMLPAP